MGKEWQVGKLGITIGLVDLLLSSTRNGERIRREGCSGDGAPGSNDASFRVSVIEI